MGDLSPESIIQVASGYMAAKNCSWPWKLVCLNA